MIKAEYIISLIRAHLNNENEHFLTLALQIAANEAKKWHNITASDIKKNIDSFQNRNSRIHNKVIPSELNWLIIESTPSNNLIDLIAPKNTIDKIKRIIYEYSLRNKLYSNNLKNRRKILLTGHPGTWKTFTASIISSELRLPLYTVLMEKLVTKYMWETSMKLRQVFDLIKSRPGIYLFDEFDAIWWERSRDNDVWEMRRVLNSFLQFLEHDDSESIIIAITNSPSLLDQALFRRFDDIIAYSLPTDQEKLFLLKSYLWRFWKKLNFNKILPKINWLSHAEITLACMDSIKEVVLNDDIEINDQLVMRNIEDRNLAYHHKS